MKNAASLLSFAVALWACVPAAQAQTYVGITGGATRADIACANTLRCDTQDTGLKVRAGHKWGPHWAAEGAYTELGRFRGLTASPSNPFTFNLSSWSVGGAYFVDLAPKVTGVGRFGLSASRVKFSTTGSVDIQSKAAPYFGIGLGYSVTPDLTIDGSFDYTGIRYNGDRSRGLLFGIGLTYGF